MHYCTHTHRTARVFYPFIHLQSTCYADFFLTAGATTLVAGVVWWLIAEVRQAWRSERACRSSAPAGNAKREVTWRAQHRVNCGDTVSCAMRDSATVMSTEREKNA